MTPPISKNGPLVSLSPPASLMTIGQRVARKIARTDTTSSALPSSSSASASSSASTTATSQQLSCAQAVNDALTLANCSSASIDAAQNACLLAPGATPGDYVTFTEMQAQCDTRLATRSLHTRPKPESTPDTNGTATTTATSTRDTSTTTSSASSHTVITIPGQDYAACIADAQQALSGCLTQNMGSGSDAIDECFLTQRASEEACAPLSSTASSSSRGVDPTTANPTVKPEQAKSAPGSSEPGLGFLAWVSGVATATNSVVKFAVTEALDYFPSVKNGIEAYVRTRTIGAVSGGVAAGAVTVAMTSAPVSFLVSAAVIGGAVDKISDRFGIPTDSTKSLMAKNMVSGLITAGVITGVTMTSLPEILAGLAVASLISISTGVTLDVALQKVKESLTKSAPIAGAAAPRDGDHMAIQMEPLGEGVV